MRSPVIAFSLIAAAAVSPSLVSGAPTSPQLDQALRQTEAAAKTHQIRGLPEPIGTVADTVTGLAGGAAPAAPGAPAAQPSKAAHTDIDEPLARTQAFRQNKGVPGVPSAQGQGQGAGKGTNPAQNQQRPVAKAAPTDRQRARRADYDSQYQYDSYKAGGDAYSGSSGKVDGGSAINNVDSYDRLHQRRSVHGFAFGGNGYGKGPGGDAYTGNSGTAEGGSIVNTNDGDFGYDDRYDRYNHNKYNQQVGDGVAVANTNAAGSNIGGTGGFSESGTAVGGDADYKEYDSGNYYYNNRHNDGYGDRYSEEDRPYKRAEDKYAAGGSAYSGSTDDVNGGYIANKVSSEDTLTNTGANTGGAAGGTYSGDAYGGKGYGYGPGGNAYTGYSGNAAGGTVYNEAGMITNNPAAR
ncbi:uncharacterized protein BXZ73DRAFT_79799 [Epithele typhae]|uniref:uncharacterized protein n=1 Tax=Epithele typhae TaxID=378194 RepID=UPI0020077CD8|nr:uncharacterized protein BXZ73DRAFT_79799 [Epithele typhae]KAH9922002.1 hypothetical protein BXZ73DRAFT_79799 [Epithele typhae]